MLIHTRGIVFRTVKYRDTSLIVDIYTEARGLQSYIVNGVRSKNNRGQAVLYQVMSILDLVAGAREDKGLNRIQEVKAAYVYQDLPFDVRKAAVGLFITEVARKTIRETEANEALFDFLFQSFVSLDQTKHSAANFHLHFMLELSGFLGFMPGGDWDENRPIFNLQDGTFCAESPNAPYCLDQNMSQLWYDLLQCAPSDLHSLAMIGTQRRKLLSHILEYYRLHLEHFPELLTLPVLQEVLS
jgi:DNA repair protein RecO (recombination protein O)